MEAPWAHETMPLTWEGTGRRRFGEPVHRVHHLRAARRPSRRLCKKRRRRGQQGRGPAPEELTKRAAERGRGMMGLVDPRPPDFGWKAGQDLSWPFFPSLGKSSLPSFITTRARFPFLGLFSRSEFLTVSRSLSVWLSCRRPSAASPSVNAPQVFASSHVRNLSLSLLPAHKSIYSSASGAFAYGPVPGINQ